MGVDVFDIVALIFAILLTIRKLDAQSRRPEEFPNVPPAAFADWQRREVAIYRLGVWACFLKVGLDPAFTFFVAPHVSFGLARIVSATIDLGWLAVLIATFVRARRIAKLRRSLGILLGGMIVNQPPARDREDDED